MNRLWKISAAVLAVLLFLPSLPVRAATLTIDIPGTVAVSGGGAGQAFPFLLTQTDGAGAPLPGGIRATAMVDTSAQTLSFSANFPDGDGKYYFRLEQDVAQQPAGWSYDRTVFLVVVTVTSGAATVVQYFPAGTFESSVRVTDAQQSMTVDNDTNDTDVINATGGNLHEEGLGNGLQCYLHENGTQGTMHYRYVNNRDSSDVVMPTAYCIDYTNLHTDGLDYQISTDWGNFEEHFPDTHNQILWLARHGFTSTRIGDYPGTAPWDPFGVADVDNNLSDVAGLALMPAEELTGRQDPTGADGSGRDGHLSEEEAYSATQLALWHFTNGITWKVVPGNVWGGLGANERCIDENHTDIDAAHQQLIAQANAAPPYEKSISQMSAAVHFDLSAARYAGGLYGPVTPSVVLSPNLAGAAATLTVGPENGAALYADPEGNTPLPANSTLPSGTPFYASLDGVSIPDTAFASASADVTTRGLPAGAIRETYLLKATDGTWATAQALLGMGLAYPHLGAQASLAGAFAFRLVPDPVAFVNSYSAPSSPSQPYAPADASAPRGPGSPQTGGGSGVYPWAFAGALALAGLGACGGALRKKPSRKGKGAR